MPDLSSILNSLFGRSAQATPTTGPTYTASPRSEYPTSDDVNFARKYDYSYGQPWAPEFEGKSARILAGNPNQVPIPAATLGAPKPLDTLVPQAAPLKDYYAKAALASEGSALAKLGFDPNKAAVDLVHDPAHTDPLGEYKSGKGVDQIYANARSPSTIVHESIHRGIRKLSESPFWKPEFDEFRPATPNDEYLVRHLMQSKMGDPTVPEFKNYMPDAEKYLAGPAQKGSGRELEETARALFNPKVSSLADKRKKILDAMEDAAAQYIAQKRPGGPR